MMWKRVALKNLLSIPVQNGYSPVCPGTSNGKWILGLGALNGSGLDVTQVKPAPIGDKKVDDFFLQPGDFLISRSNTVDKVGRSAMFRGEIDNCSYPDLMMRFRVDTSRIYPEFLEVYLRSAEAIRHFQRSASGTSGTMVKINKSVVESLLVPLLPKCEQTAIADLLSTWDAAIEKTERLIAAKERWLDALKQDLLTGSKRIKGFKGNWRRYRLSDVLTEHGELSSGKEEVFSVSVHKGLINQVEHLGRSFAAKDLANYNLVKPGDIVYTKSPTGDFPYGIIKQSRVDVPVIVSPLYGVFAPRDRHLGTFLDFYFESPIRTKNYLNPIIQKGAKNTINITNKTFLSNKLYLPTCAEETKAIADTLNSTRQEINLLKKQAEAYRRQKRGLMQKLLTGGWRVKTSKEVVNG
jgi:type I restriction enzyme S subunit